MTDEKMLHILKHGRGFAPAFLDRAVSRAEALSASDSAADQSRAAAFAALLTDHPAPEDEAVVSAAGDPDVVAEEAAAADVAMSAAKSSSATKDSATKSPAPDAAPEGGNEGGKAAGNSPSGAERKKRSAT
ncbi:MAG: hypothetical protein V2J26_04945 [Pacificimonas sp.]|jgi:hypothetical protein|nr:hypothetical protein [Pacificimonas sp.]